MKILYVATISGTINAFLIPHILMLLDMGHTVDIACKVKSPLNEVLVKRGCKVFNISFDRSPVNRRNCIAYSNLKRLLDTEKYDLVHTHTPVASFLVRLICKNYEKPMMLYTAHGFHFYKQAPIKSWMYYFMEVIAARWTDGVITINQEDYVAAQKMRTRSPNGIYKVNGVGIDLNRFRNVRVSKGELRKNYGYEEEFILFYAAELNTNKHQDLLISTVNLLKDRIPNLKLLLAGEGSSRKQYEKQVNYLGLQDYVSFLGFRDDVPQLLRIADVYVASSFREGLPVNIMEAMATGLPLVVTDCRGHRDLVVEGHNGYLVGMKDEIGFSNAVYKLYKSDLLREEFGRNSLESIRGYDLPIVIAEMKQIYDRYTDTSRIKSTLV